MPNILQKLGVEDCELGKAAELVGDKESMKWGVMEWIKAAIFVHGRGLGEFRKN